ncbi:NADP-reducing hydrogenase subunit HndA [Sedimentisphaera cyanobacteriorum]|uniref:NADP-reducing hydrogenase subunit HndA n=1 Tax=Sedimentisphaera cyanobacteriorum TaxID=1940790 RepID=A0A1Q2HMQ7_9BACT|nr:NAD(P)H-dependent oxidoreductase subunit E [Sedimentisphaera cyanobacteriorum]AQQ08523.1 NADP-reducing hydrogenase subunit HndA [Sedimentisphaera cyanobacteriorum]
MPDYTELKQYIDSLRDKPHFESYLIAVLHKAQKLYGYLTLESMNIISQQMNIPTAHIWGVATFYSFFNLSEKGKHNVAVCMGTACYVKGANVVLDTLKKELGVEVGGTTDDMLFTLQEARCVGACGLAPVMMIDDEIYGDLTPEKTVEIIKAYRENAKAAG